LSSQQHGDAAGGVGEVSFDRVVDRFRLAARDVEAATGEMFRLTRGKRKRRQHDREPGEHDPTPAATEEPCEFDHEVAHWLVGQPFGQTASRL
jgi:hypothetical protein